MVRHGLLKSDTSGAAVSQFLSTDGPGLVFPVCFFGRLQAGSSRLAFLSTALCERVCVCFFLPSWAQL